MREHHTGNRGVEAGGNRTGDAATDEDIGGQKPAGGLAKETSHRRAKMHQRPILPDRGTSAGRNEGRQGRTEPALYIEFVIGSVRCIDAVSRTVPARNSKNAPDHKDQAGGNHETQ